MEKTGRLANFGQNNKRRGCNKRGGWQKPPKLINGEVGINRGGGEGDGTTQQVEISVK